MANKTAILSWAFHEPSIEVLSSNENNVSLLHSLCLTIRKTTPCLCDARCGHANAKQCREMIKQTTIVSHRVGKRNRKLETHAVNERKENTAPPT